jgi:hypothetical protein
MIVDYCVKMCARSLIVSACPFLLNFQIVLSLPILRCTLIVPVVHFMSYSPCPRCYPVLVLLENAGIYNQRTIPLRSSWKVWLGCSISAYLTRALHTLINHACLAAGGNANILVNPGLNSRLASFVTVLDPLSNCASTSCCSCCSASLTSVSCNIRLRWSHRSHATSPNFWITDASQRFPVRHFFLHSKNRCCTSAHPTTGNPSSIACHPTLSCSSMVALNPRKFEIGTVGASSFLHAVSRSQSTSMRLGKVHACIISCFSLSIDFIHTLSAPFPLHFHT